MSGSARSRVLSLWRALRYAMERQHLQRTLSQLSLADELTGLYNRRGFCTLCEHHLKLASRTRGLVLVSADVEGFAEITERYGEREGDRALLKAADILRATFRASDVIARVGEDEFAVLLVDASSESVEIIRSRLRQRLEAYNRREGNARGYALALVYSVTHFPPGETPLLDELLALGDAGLVEPLRAAGAH